MEGCHRARTGLLRTYAKGCSKLEEKVESRSFLDLESLRVGKEAPEAIDEALHCISQASL